MSKCDICVSRSMTVNVGNYSSIKPAVSITLKDVDTKEVTTKYQKLSEVLDVLMLMETVTLGNEADSITSMGYKNYIEALEKVDGAIDIATGILENL